MRKHARAGFFRLRSQWRGQVFRRTMRRLAGPKLLPVFADAYPEAFFIEIGANDGEQWDPLRPFVRSRRWAGIMVEPVPHVFERLRDNYGALDRVVLENAAIAQTDGRMPFYQVAPHNGEAAQQDPDWYDAIGSFSRETVLRHAHQVPDLQRRIVRTEVPCLTFASLCRKHDVDRVDLVLIDTEGYDYEVVKQIDLATYRPRLLIYEHFLLPPEQRTECRRLVERFGYSTMEEGFDTWCLDTSRDDVVTRQWHRLRPTLPALSAHDPEESGGAGESEERTAG